VHWCRGKGRRKARGVETAVGKGQWWPSEFGVLEEGKARESLCEIPLPLRDLYIVSGSGPTPPVAGPFPTREAIPFHHHMERR